MLALLPNVMVFIIAFVSPSRPHAVYTKKCVVNVFRRHRYRIRGKHKTFPAVLWPDHLSIALKDRLVQVFCQVSRGGGQGSRYRTAHPVLGRPDGARARRQQQSFSFINLCHQLHLCTYVFLLLS